MDGCEGELLDGFESEFEELELPDDWGFLLSGASEGTEGREGLDELLESLELLLSELGLLLPAPIPPDVDGRLLSGLLG